jgi:hypothetical protein
MNFGDVGILCLDREIQEECQNCLWREWDALKGSCRNGHSPICFIYRQKLFLADAGHAVTLPFPAKPKGSF